MRLDVHSHLYPIPFVELMAELGREDLRNGPAQDLDLSGRVAQQDAAGVDCQLLSLVGPNTVVADAGGALAAAQLVNDLYATLCGQYPGRFLALAMLPLPHVDRAIREADRAMRSPTCVGVALPCSVSGIPLDDPRFDELWAWLDERRALVYIHPVGSDSLGHWGLDDYGLGPMFGSPLQLGVAACRLVFTGVTSRYPHTRIVLAQEGGFLASRWEAIENVVLRPGLAGHAPYMLGWVNSLEIDRDDPMAAFRRFLFDTSALHKTPTMLESVRHAYGIDRLVLGSDSLFLSLEETVSFLESTPALDAAERVRILDGHADSLLGANA